MFDADRPIQNSSQDRLGRHVFAKYLARCILDHTSPESLVIGLYGSWGSGKTSVINLMLEELHYAANNMFEYEMPIILNFSAWSYAGQNQLIENFFRRLSSEMRRSPHFENSARIIHLLELYVSFFTHKPVPKSLRPKHFWLTRYFKPAQTTEEMYGWESGQDLTQVKAELNDLLRHQKHKIIIIMDNISRLEAKEFNQVFQIVKSIGDYANTVYVLAMDKEQALITIDSIYGTGGHELLEKTVQLPFTIPPIAKQDLENILLDRLKKIITLAPEGAWDKIYWADIYYSSLRYYFENCRDITRYINTLNFSFVYVKDLVNPVDFFAITALEVFEPDVYGGVRDNKDLFTDLVDNVSHFDAKKLSEDKRRCDEILQRAKTIPREFLLALLIRLFPHLRSVYEPNTPFYHSEAIARKNKRICSLDEFDIYFRMIISKGYIGDAEMNAILSLAGDEEGFALALLRLNQDERIPKFLDLLDTYGVNHISTGVVHNVVNALIDSADLFPEGEDTALNFNIPMRIHRILHQLLRRFSASEKRYEVFRDAITKSINSIYIIVHELTVQQQEHKENADTFVPVEHRDFNPEQLDALQKLTVTKIKHWAEIGRLVEHPKLLPLLYAWKSWGSVTECQDYVEKIVETDEGLLAFLMAVLEMPIEKTMTKLTKDPDWIKYLKIIEDFIAPDYLKKHAVAMFEALSFEKLREKEQLAILIFLNLIQAKTSKKVPLV